MNIEKVKKRVAKCIVRGGTDLNLSGCELTDIPDFVFEQLDAAKIEHLELHDNLLEKMPDSIAKFTNLKDLDASENQFAAFPSQITKLKTLQTLYIYSNQFAEIPVEIEQLSNLRLLFVGDNKLAALPAAIGSLKNLTGLNIVRNEGLTLLPMEIKLLSNLKILDMDEKNIPQNAALLELLPKDLTVLTGSSKSRGF
jgi:Leucine-rich repeat (LRR) protein